MNRRQWLWVLSSLLCTAGCSGAPIATAPPKPAPLPPLRIDTLDLLLPRAGLRWVIFIHPSEWASLPWLKPAVALIVPDGQFDQFAQRTGIELRSLEQAAIALYRDEKERESLVYLGKASAKPEAVEQWMFKRLTGQIKRAQDRPDLLRLSGRIGDSPHALTLLGANPMVFVLQTGGSLHTGPARIAALFAEQKLKRSPAVLAQDPLKALSARLGPAPLLAFALGPFEGELSRGARGLLSAAVALGCSARPSAREGLAFTLVVSGDFRTDAQGAADQLHASWNDFAQSSFGHLLGLDQPKSPALPTHASDGVAIAVEIDPMKLAQGLASATSRSVEEIMR